ncbi:MAG: VWA domain-containing protein [Chloroflexia bacterium]|nr:VWA domain-containing protein [Chloroflexia bacterium]
MKGKQNKRSVLLLALVGASILWVLLMSLGFSGSGSSTASDGTTARVTLINKKDFPLVRVHVLVEDEDGQAVRSVRKEDMALFEDGIPVDMSGFQGAGEQEITAILVLDRSGSMDDERKMEGAQAAALQFVSLMRPGDRAGLIVFDERVEVLVPLGSDANDLRTAIQGVYPDGGTAFYDAVYAAVDQLEHASGRPAIIALTDGLDNESRRSLAQLISHAQERYLPIYTIGLGRDAEEGSLRRLAEETGGLYFYAPSGDELVDLYTTLAQELQNEYVLEYTSPTPRLDGTSREVVAAIQTGVGEISVQERYSVSGLLAVSRNPLFFLALLVPLLLLAAGPALLKRRRQGVQEKEEPDRPVGPEIAAAVPPTPPALAEKALPVKGPPAPPTSEPLPLPSAPPPAPAVRSRLIRRFVLDKPLLNLGSAPDNDIVLGGAGMAARQAQVAWSENRWTVQNLGRTEMAVSFRGPPDPFRPTGHNAIRQGSQVRWGQILLTVQVDADGGTSLLQEFVLEEGQIAGGAAGCDVVVAGANVAAQHARFSRQAGRWVVTDLSGGRLQVSYSGDPGQFRTTKQNALQDGSLLRLGEVVLQFRA